MGYDDEAIVELLKPKVIKTELRNADDIEKYFGLLEHPPFRDGVSVLEAHVSRTD